MCLSMHCGTVMSSYPSGNDMKLRRQNVLWWELLPTGLNRTLQCRRALCRTLKKKTPHRIHLSHCCYQNNPKASSHGTTGHFPKCPSGHAIAVTSPGCWWFTRTHLTPQLFSTAMQKFTLHSRNPFRGIIFLLISKKNNGMYSKFFLWWPTINHFIAQVTSSMGRKMSCHH